MRRERGQYAELSHGSSNCFLGLRRLHLMPVTRRRARCGGTDFQFRLQFCSIMELLRFFVLGEIIPCHLHYTLEGQVCVVGTVFRTHNASFIISDLLKLSVTWNMYVLLYILLCAQLSRLRAGGVRETRVSYLLSNESSHIESVQIENIKIHIFLQFHWVRSDTATILHRLLLLSKKWCCNHAAAVIFSHLLVIKWVTLCSRDGKCKRNTECLRDSVVLTNNDWGLLIFFSCSKYFFGEYARVELESWEWM